MSQWVRAVVVEAHEGLQFGIEHKLALHQERAMGHMHGRFMQAELIWAVLCAGALRQLRSAGVEAFGVPYYLA